ncbi:hypothetical protein [Corynebacterium sp. AOP12-C2-36]|uniref:hypothetical protein n=1 Tax=Corynebacterium sp. AOP12-C2-36 TaxID=3457723 RepID=UPI0040336477
MPQVLTSSRTLPRRAFLGGAVTLAMASFAAACASSDGGSGGDGGDAAASGAAQGTSGEHPSRVVALSTGHLDHCLAMGVLPVGLAVAVSDATDSRGQPRTAAESPSTSATSSTRTSTWTPSRSSASAWTPISRWSPH